MNDERTTDLPAELSQHLLDWLPFVVVLLASILIGLVLTAAMRRGTVADRRMHHQVAFIVLVLATLVALTITLPASQGGLITEATKGNLLGLIGLGVTALITLSSTTLAANAMAGLMLRRVGAFRSGDFVRVDSEFGRVTERGLFHTEIQTEDRDLVTLPNLFIATHPVRVVRASGTIITAEVSLGYDEEHTIIRDLLTKAAESVGLAEPYVLIISLEDHAVVYRVCGFLAEVKTLISVRSALRAAVLDSIHGAGLEIVSPRFMNQRPMDPAKPVIPRRPVARATSPEAPAAATAPEDIAFDKAEQAERLEQLRAERTSIAKDMARLGHDLKAADEASKPAIEAECEGLRARLQVVEHEIDSLAEPESKPDARPEAKPDPKPEAEREAKPKGTNG